MRNIWRAPCLVDSCHRLSILLSPLRVMTPIVPPYASRFMHLSMSFPSENILHVELKRFIFSRSLTEPSLQLRSKLSPAFFLYKATRGYIQSQAIDRDGLTWYEYGVAFDRIVDNPTVHVVNPSENALITGVIHTYVPSLPPLQMFSFAPFTPRE